jgi:long-chain acyl-CoA synthetase
MRNIDVLENRLCSRSVAEVIRERGRVYSYADLAKLIQRQKALIDSRGCAGQLVALLADYGIVAIAMELALLKSGCAVALISRRGERQELEMIELCQAQWICRIQNDDSVMLTPTGMVPVHPLLTSSSWQDDSAIILFTSGSSGRPKAVVHSSDSLIARHIRKQKRSLRTIAFLLFDHIGGLNTLLYVLCNGGTLVIPESRQPEVIARVIKEDRVQALTTSPTFLNLLIWSGVAAHHDLSSLEVINFGSEPIPQGQLDAISKLLPHTRLVQGYGLTETGIIPAATMPGDARWIRLGDESCHVRLVDGLLEVKSETSMRGYLNHPSPFTPDGYFKTGDAVEQQGEYLRILGRHSDLINVGGKKVYPAEIETVLRELDGVLEVAVRHEPYPITGNLICAKFRLTCDEPLLRFKQRLYEFCRGRLQPFQIPRKISLSDTPLHNERFKTIRTN